MLILAAITHLFILPDRFYFLVHALQLLTRRLIYALELTCGLACIKLDMNCLSKLLCLALHILELLLDYFVQFARPEEVLQHVRCELREKHSHETEHAFAD